MGLSMECERLRHRYDQSIREEGRRSQARSVIKDQLTLMHCRFCCLATPEKFHLEEEGEKGSPAE